MSEFQIQLQARVHEAIRSISEAEASGDDYSVTVHRGELEGIAWLAREHEVPLPELDGFCGGSAA